MASDSKLVFYSSTKIYLITKIKISSIDIVIYIYIYVIFMGSQWLRGLRHGFSVARLQGLRVRIPPAAWMSVLSVLCYRVEVSATGRSLVQRSPTECGVSECDRGTS